MIVADTSPLNYLILIDVIEVLPELFRDVAIPPAVEQELLAKGSSEKVRKWIENSPDWLRVTAVRKIVEEIKLGKGEVEAISLAVELSADLILLDDKAARFSATAANLNVIGTLGILKFADENKLIDFETAIKKLQMTNFRASRRLLEDLIKQQRQEKFSN